MSVASPALRRARLLLAWGVLLAAGASDQAYAHGPFGCLDPRVAAAGQTVRVTSGNPAVKRAEGYPAYRVIFNPRRSDLGIAPGYLAAAFRTDAPSVTVLDRRKSNPTRRARFAVPAEAPPGLYMVLVFDGEEGGAHNTWDYLHVVAPDEADPVGVSAASLPPSSAPSPSGAAPKEVPSENAPPSWPTLALAVTGALGMGVLFGRRDRSTR